MLNAIHILLHGIVDYAGLFPPAGLDMGPAGKNYAAYLRGEHAWMLGRFIVPVARLEEFENAAISHLPKRNGAEPWLLSALAGPNLSADIPKIAEFNRRHSNGASAGLAKIDALEMKAGNPDAIAHMVKSIPDSLTPYVEIPIDKDPAEFVAAIGHVGGRAKVRTGGVAPGSTPRSDALARFMYECVNANVPFKATAGLHHPLRSAEQHGFLNVFLAAAFLRAGLRPDAASDMLDETHLYAFLVADDRISWHADRVENELLFTVRRTLAIAFGSCSFTEPVEDLASLSLL